MIPVKPNHLAKILRDQAEAVVKSASSSTGAPSTADGVAQVTKVTVPTDPGEAELKKDLPTDGVAGDSTNAMETAALHPSSTPAADKGAPGELPKMAAARVSNVRNALLSVFPGVAVKAAAGTAAPAAAPAAGVAPAKSASAPAGDLDLSPDMLIKLAKAVLATNEGVAFAQYTMEKAAGAEHAADMINMARASALAHDDTLYTKQAAYNEGLSKAAAIHAELSAMITEADADSIIKQASLHCTNLEILGHPMLKAAYADGMQDAASLEGGAEAKDDKPSIPGGGEQLTMEDVVALLQEMIAKGEISEDDVVKGLQELESQNGGADPSGGAPPADPSVTDPAAAPAASADAPPADAPAK